MTRTRQRIGLTGTHRAVHQAGEAVERGIQKFLVGLELLPGVDGAAGRDDRERQGTPRPAPTRTGCAGAAPARRAGRSRRARRRAGPATTLLVASPLPSPLLRASAAIGSSRSPVKLPSGPTLNRSAGGKHSLSGSPGLPPTITGMMKSLRPSALKRRTSSLTYSLFAAFGEQTTIRNCEASSAAMVCAASEGPAEKSSRSRKIGRSVLRHRTGRRRAADEVLADGDRFPERGAATRPTPCRGGCSSGTRGI